MLTHLKQPARLDAGTVSFCLAIALILAWFVFSSFRELLPWNQKDLDQSRSHVVGFFDSKKLVSPPNAHTKYGSTEWFDKVQGGADDVHLVISSGCSGYQNWQCESLLYSWARLQHSGRITRIVSGCKSQAARHRAATSAVPNADNRILWFFTDDFAIDSKGMGGRKFVYFNKPFSMQLWVHSERNRFNDYLGDLQTMQHSISIAESAQSRIEWKSKLTDLVNAQIRNGADVSTANGVSNGPGLYESNVVLLDPDFLVLRSFLFHLKAYATEHCRERIVEFQKQSKKGNLDGSGHKGQTVEECADKLWLRKGHPISQVYGLGAKFVHWPATMCPPERKGCDPSVLTEKYAWDHYSIGPPYLMHTEDWETIVDDWVRLSPDALKNEPPPSILAEMYSYSIACAYNNLPHEMLHSMVTSPHSSIWSESWALPYALKPHSVLDSPVKKGAAVGNGHVLEWTHRGPLHIVHMCQGFWLGKSRNHGTVRNGGWNFHKGHVPQNFLYDCDIPLFVEMPLELTPDSLLSNAKRKELLPRLLQGTDLSEAEMQQLAEALSPTIGAWKRHNRELNRTQFAVDFVRKPSGLREEMMKALVSPWQLFDSRDIGKDDGVKRNVWFLSNVLQMVNEATANYRRKHCASDWRPKYGLLLQQPESDHSGNRMSYVINEFGSKRTWAGH